MKAAALLVLLSGCTCFDSAYDQYCLSHFCAGQGGGEALGGGGGGSVPDSGSGGGGGATGGGEGGGGSVPVDALALELVSPFKATTCQAASIVLHDGTTHLAAPAPSDLAIALDGGSGITFFSEQDPACVSTPLTAVTLPAQQSQVAFHVRADAFGEALLTAQSPPLVPAQLTVTSTALARLIVSTDVIPSNTGCPVPLTLRVVDEDTKSLPVTAMGAATVHFVPSGGLIGFGTSTCANTFPFDAVIASGQSAATLYAGAQSGATCGSFSTLTVSSMNLAPGLSLDGTASTASFYDLKYPPTVTCGSDPQCCNGTCASQQCN